MTESFNNLVYDVLIDVNPGVYHNFDDPWRNALVPEKIMVNGVLLTNTIIGLIVTTKGHGG